MKWESKDLKQYVQAKEYVDTVIIPLQPFHLSHDTRLEKDSYQREVLTIYANEIEKELTGRVLLTPTYNYLKSSNIDDEAIRLNKWLQDMKEQPFHNIFTITFDASWKKVEKSIDCELLWLPGIKSGNLQSKETISIIRNQTEQISELIRSYW